MGHFQRSESRLVRETSQRTWLFVFVQASGYLTRTGLSFARFSWISRKALLKSLGNIDLKLDLGTQQRQSISKVKKKETAVVTRKFSVDDTSDSFELEQKKLNIGS